MKKRKIMAMLLTVAMTATALAGCGGPAAGDENQDSGNNLVNTQADNADVPDTGAGEDEPQASGGDKTITVSMTAKTGVQEGWDAVAAAYMDLHPDVKVVVDLKAEEGYDQWLNNVFATSDTTAVDIVAINYGGGSETGKHIDWNDYADMDSPYSDGVWKDQFQYDMQTIEPGTGMWKQLCLQSTQVMWFYNQNIFDEVGVSIPTTWDELIDVCEKIEAAGYQAIAMPGDYDSFYSGTMGWLSQIYADQTTRSSIEYWRSQEGDFTWDPDVDAAWTYDPTDPWNDDTVYVTRNPVRFFQSIQDGTFTPDTEGMKTVWNNFAKVFPKYAGNETMFGTNKDGAQTLFYQGKAAMTVNGGWGIMEFANNMKAINNGESISVKDSVVEDAKVFTLGTFSMPTMEGDGIEAPVRTIEVPEGFLGAVSKGQEHDELVADFVMYYSSAEGMSVFLDAAIAAGFAPSGPSLVYNVDYPDEVANAFANVKYVGNAQKNYGNALSRGLCELPESTREYYNNAHAFLTGSITVDEYLKTQVENFKTYFNAALESKGITAEDLANPAAEPAGLK